MSNDICTIMNHVKKQINDSFKHIIFAYYGPHDTQGLWKYIANISDSYLIIVCKKQIEATNIPIRLIYNWYSFQIVSNENIHSPFLSQLPEHNNFCQFQEINSFLIHDDKYKPSNMNSKRIHRYFNDLFSIFVKAPNENSTMLNKAKISSILNTFWFEPVVVDLTSCNVTPD